MSDDSQILIPPSFIALYLKPGSSKLQAPKEDIAARYEFCEDLANLLTDTASTMQFQLGITENDVLERVKLGLADEHAPVNATEVQWVLSRLAELLGWHVSTAGPEI